MLAACLGSKSVLPQLSLLHRHVERASTFAPQCRHGYLLYMHSYFTLGRVCYHPGNPTLLANKDHLQEGDTLPWIDIFEMKPEKGKNLYTIESVRLGGVGRALNGAMHT